MQKDDDGTIDLRRNSEESEFRINHIEKVGTITPVSAEEIQEEASDPYSKVKVKFDKFVSLIANHAYEEIFDKHSDEDVIISTDLLTDLANSHEEKSDKKMPVIFIGGLVLGCVLMWFLLKS